MESKLEPLIISYFTRDPYYEKEAASLIASCEKWGLDYCIEGIAPFGKWHEHTCYKPTFISQKLQEQKRPVVWIDADAEIVQKPTLFTELDTDLALRFCEGYPSDHPSFLYAGTIYFNYTPQVVQFVEEWAKRCQQGLREGRLTVDQYELIRLLLLEKMRIHPLPRGYVAIFEEEMAKEEQYIVHYQASRLYKKVIDGELALGILEQLNLAQLRQLRPRLADEARQRSD